MKKTYGWNLDYTWANRTAWSEQSDVLLEGKFTLKQKEDLKKLELILLEFEKDFAYLDKEKIEVFYMGGVQAHLEKKDEKNYSLYLHSRGQDAFDSLNYYSKYIEESMDISINWIEHPHNREKNILSFKTFV